MIREFKASDIEEVMNLWLFSNIESHSFINDKYFKDNFNMVRKTLPDALIYVYEYQGEVVAFSGVMDRYIAGIFVASKIRSKGIGKKLLDTLKSRFSSLSLNVYEKNIRARNFYLREGFIAQSKQIDKNTSEVEMFMIWSRDGRLDQL